MRHRALLIVLAVTLHACGAGGPAPPPPEREPDPAPTPTAPQPETPPSPEPAPIAQPSPEPSEPPFPPLTDACLETITLHTLTGQGRSTTTILRDGTVQRTGQGTGATARVRRPDALFADVASTLQQCGFPAIRTHPIQHDTPGVRRTLTLAIRCEGRDAQFDEETSDDCIRTLADRVIAAVR